MSLAPTGVLSLRDALRRARKAGAAVSQIPRTGEWRVEAPGHSRLTISGSRKDETPELHKLVRELEAAMPAQLAQPAPPLPPAKPGSFRDRVVAWLDMQQSDPDGWISYPGSGKIAAALGDIRPVAVAYTVNALAKRGYAELRRKPTPPGSDPLHMGITGIRLTGALKPQRPQPATRTLAVIREDAAKRQPPADYRDQPLRPAPSVRLGPMPGVPDSPKLAAYAEARKLAHGHPMLSADPTESDVADILTEAVRLYWWLRTERR